MNPKISIVIPIYNAEKFLETCIDSVINQTFTDFELILIDDCSTDNSFNIIQQYKDPRIQIHQTFVNSGEGSATSFGLGFVKGKYLYIMGDDDILLPKTLETLFNVAEESNADAVYMNKFYVTHDEDALTDGKVTVRLYDYQINPTPRIMDNDLQTRLTKEFLQRGVFVTNWIKLCRTDFYMKNDCYPNYYTLNGDILVNLSVLTFAKIIRVVECCGYVYRQHSSNTMNQPKKNRFVDGITLMNNAVDFLEYILNRTELPPEFKTYIENFTMKEQFSSITTFYNHGQNINQVNLEFEKIFKSGQYFNPKLIRLLCNYIADQTFALEELKRRLS